jgi:hypothetical protein
MSSAYRSIQRNEIVLSSIVRCRRLGAHRTRARRKASVGGVVLAQLCRRSSTSTQLGMPRPDGGTPSELEVDGFTHSLQCGGSEGALGHAPLREGAGQQLAEVATCACSGGITCPGFGRWLSTTSPCWALPRREPEHPASYRTDERPCADALLALQRRLTNV